MEKEDNCIGLHLLATTIALGPIAICTYSIQHSWAGWAIGLTSILAFMTVISHLNMARGFTPTAFNGSTTGMGFLLQMPVVIAIILIEPGIIRGVLGMILSILNYTTYSILKRAMNGLSPITPDNPNGE